MDKKTAIQQEIERRKGEIRINKWIKTACMGKTVKEAYDILQSHEFLEIFNDNTPPAPETANEYPEKSIQSLLDLFSFFIFEEVFMSIWAQQNFWNCRHHGLDCGYILTEKDLTED